MERAPVSIQPYASHLVVAVMADQMRLAYAGLFKVVDVATEEGPGGLVSRVTARPFDPKSKRWSRAKVDLGAAWRWPQPAEVGQHVRQLIADADQADGSSTSICHG